MLFFLIEELQYELNILQEYYSAYRGIEVEQTCLIYLDQFLLQFPIRAIYDLYHFVQEWIYLFQTDEYFQLSLILRFIFGDVQIHISFGQNFLL